mgnify:CR=1 FL=1
MLTDLTTSSLIDVLRDPSFFRLHSFLTELLFCIGNAIDVVEIHTQAFRRRKLVPGTSSEPAYALNPGVTAGTSGIQASINNAVDPASEWTLHQDGTVRERKTGNGDDDSLDGALIGEDAPDPEEEELIMQMRADGVSEDVMRVKLDTWHVQHGRVHSRREKQEHSKAMSLAALREEKTRQLELEMDDKVIRSSTR